ncbi:MAG: aldehyde dehydrogenase family protein [Brevinema sp.]
MNTFMELKKKQEHFFQTGATQSLIFRKTQLQKLKSLLYSYFDELIDALKKDLDKSEFESIASELYMVVDEIDCFCKNLSKWNKPKKVRKAFFTFDSTGTVLPKPLGTSLIIAPWNYPVQLTMSPLVGAIGGGNCAIIKPAAATPNVSAVIEKMINTHFDEKYIKVVTGNRQVISELLDLEFDKIFLTGSLSLGKIVMEKTAKYITDVTLELGGKSPVIVDELSKKDLKTALRRIIWGKSLNGGQTCIAPDYLLLPATMEANFLSLFQEIVQEFVHEKKSYRIVNKSQYDRLKAYMDNGEILFGGNTDDETLSMELTIMKINDLDVPILKDEIFGPILPIIFYDQKQDVLNMIRDICQFPLALYIFTNNKSFSTYFTNAISFGGACINDTISHILNHDLPFGGVRTSGVGTYHGYASFECFTKKTAILSKSLMFEFPFRYPAYKHRAHFIKSIFMKKK